jgi:hypothetical protein
MSLPSLQAKGYPIGGFPIYLTGSSLSWSSLIELAYYMNLVNEAMKARFKKP